MNQESTPLSKLNYIKNVLGVSSVFRPKGPVRVYGVLRGECLVLSDECYEGENKELIARVMRALKIKSYDVVCIDSLYFSKQEPALLFSLVKNIIARAAGCKCVAFGSLWLGVLNLEGKKIALNQVFGLLACPNVSVRTAVTYSLSELSSGDKDQIRQRN